MSSLFQLVNRLAVLVVGRRPRWAVQGDTTGAPSSGSAGVSTQNALISRTQIDLRENIAFKTTMIELVDVGAGTEVEVEIDGTPVAGLVANDADALASEINAVFGSTVTATDDGDTVTVIGDDEDDYSISVTKTAGPGTVEIVHEDASTCDVKIYRLPAGTSTDRPGWAFFDEHGSLDYRGRQIEIPIGGFSRVYCEIQNADGNVKVTHGPAIEE